MKLHKHDLVLSRCEPTHEQLLLLMTCKIFSWHCRHMWIYCSILWCVT